MTRNVFSGRTVRTLVSIADSTISEELAEALKHIPRLAPRNLMRDAERLLGPDRENPGLDRRFHHFADGVPRLLLGCRHDEAVYLTPGPWTFATPREQGGEQNGGEGCATLAHESSLVGVAENPL